MDKATGTPRAALQRWRQVQRQQAEQRLQAAVAASEAAEQELRRCQQQAKGAQQALDALARRASQECSVQWQQLHGQRQAWQAEQLAAAQRLEAKAAKAARTAAEAVGLAKNQVAQALAAEQVVEASVQRWQQEQRQRQAEQQQEASDELAVHSKLGGLLALWLVLGVAVGGAQAAPRHFDTAWLRRGEHPAEARVRQALAKGDAAQAAAIARPAIDASHDAAVRGRLRWQLAVAELRRQRPAQALGQWQALGRSHHPLAMWARLRAARQLLPTEPGQALTWTSDLDTAWVGAGEAQEVQGLAAAALKRDRLARSKLAALLGSSAPRNERQAELSLALAEVLLRSDAADDRREAMLWWLRIEARLPRGESGRRALRHRQQRSDEAGCNAACQTGMRASLAEEAAAAQLRAGDAAGAQRAYAALVAGSPVGSQAQCRAGLGEARSRLQLGETQAAQTQLQRLVGACAAASARAEASFALAESLRSNKQTPQAIAAFDAVPLIEPSHALADDALVMAAALCLDARDAEGARRRLRAAADAEPPGDLAEDARFRLAMLLVADGKASEALLELGRLPAALQAEKVEGEVGRAAYWRARVRQSLGDAQAAEAYAEVAALWPPSFYAQRALERLQALDAARAQVLRRRLRALATHRPALFASHAGQEAPAFRRAVELLRVGELDRARRELEAWRGSDAASPDAAWLSASLLLAADGPQHAVRLLRGRVASLGDLESEAERVARLRLAYPQPHASTFAKAGKRSSVPVALLYAIGREESSFDADAVSPKQAYGLLQILLPTARKHDVQPRRQLDVAQLRQPAINIAVGANFLASLQQRYGSDRSAIIAAYNAGPQAVDRWRSAATPPELDAWVEAIPYKETRRYTRRVLQSFGIYHALTTGELPAVAPLPPSPGGSAERTPALQRPR